jgi:endo-alpha-1,4-polygalactosaminidase (GH114 family)
MYAEARVRERLRLAEDELRMPLAYHSVSQVEEFESRLRESAKYTYNESGKPNGTLNLTAEEAQWMIQRASPVRM